jgi:hypothetical protein
MEAGGATLTFHDDWHIEQSEPLIAGSPVRIRYAKKRLLSGSDLSTRGPHSFNLTGFLRVNGGTPTSFDLGGRGSPSEGFAEQNVSLPRETRKLELWFQRENVYGAPHYDSDFGRNYTFLVLPTLDLSGPVGRYLGEVSQILDRGQHV